MLLQKKKKTTKTNLAISVVCQKINLKALWSRSLNKETINILKAIMPTAKVRVPGKLTVHEKS